MKRSRATLAALALAMVCAAAPARGVLIATGDGSGNTTAPADDPGFTHAGVVNGLSAVYLGDGWVLTANHVGTGALTLGGVVHAAIPASAVRLDHAPGVPTDLRLFRLATDPGLSTLEISTSPPPPNGQVTLIGYGRNRGAATSWNGIDGWVWLSSRSLRWGTNRLTQSGQTIVLGGSTVRSLSFDFDEGAAGHEAVAVPGDSGGPVFVGGAASSELAGVMFANSSFQGQPAGTSLFGNGTLAADLSYYRGAILAVTSERACADGSDDDGDGLVDTADPGCLDAADPFETNAIVPCDDGFDDDGDGLIDYPDDPGCRDPQWLYEDPKCSDGLDNDGDGGIDWNGGPGGGTPDPQCTTPWRNREASGCGLGFELVLLAPLLARLRRAKSAR
jgi:hypothetical protein